jgi:hypothetical protein
MKTFSRRVLTGGCLTLLLCSCACGFGQFTDPRTYENAPVGVNSAEVDYGYGHANTSLDTSLVVEGASFHVNQGTLVFTRYFGLLGRAAWVKPSLPIGGLSGSIQETNINGSVTGTGDSSYMAGIVLKGGPALNPAEFESFKAVSTVGVSLTMTAPTGQYDENKLLNLGSDRWSFKPEIGYSVPFGREQRWTLDTYANAYFYTDNRTYRGAEILGQDPLIGVEWHLSHDFNDSVWASLDTRYSFRGTTFLDGINQGNSQQNFVLGAEVNVSVNARNSLVLALGKAFIHQNGPSISAVSVRYAYSWGNGLK